jgi:hypothetical protein
VGSSSSLVQLAEQRERRGENEMRKGIVVVRLNRAFKVVE